MGWRDHLPLHIQGWLLEAEDGFGVALKRAGEVLVRRGLHISERANDRWDVIQPQIQAAVVGAGICPACGHHHPAEEGSEGL